MGKTHIYFFFLLLFGGAVYFFIFQKTESAFPEKEAGFQTKDTASIGTIFLSIPSGESILLARTDSGWILNKKYPVFQSTLNTLMITLYQQHAVSATPDAAHNGIVKQLAGYGIKVELYDRGGDKMKVFYVGTEVHDLEGTTMLMEGAERSYTVRVGAFTGLITSRYSTDVANWRDRAIIHVDSSDIKTVSLTYTREPLNSFSITKNNGQVTLTADPGVKGEKPMNERRVNTYLSFFNRVVCEGYLNGDPDVDSLISISPKRCELNIVTKNGQRQHFDIYWMPVNERSKNQADTTRNLHVPKGFDADRYYAVGNNFKDTMLIQEYAFNKVFRKAYEFYQESPDAKVTGWEEKKK